MDTGTDAVPTGGNVQVRYWASARAASGVAGEGVSVRGPVSVRELVDTLIRQRAGQEAAHLARVLEVCSVLVGDRPTKDRGTTVSPGDTVEFLPPFAGG